MPKKYPYNKEAEQEKAPPKVNRNRELLLGKIALYNRLKKDINENQSVADEYRLEIISLMRKQLRPDVDGCLRLEESDIEVTLQTQKREYFNNQAAMDLLYSLPEKTAEKYIIQTTDKDQLASAFLQGDVTEEQLKTVFNEKEVEVLTVKDKK